MSRGISQLSVDNVVCCIYQAPHPVGESSSESSSSSDSDSSSKDESSGNDDGSAEMAGSRGKGTKRRRKRRPRDSEQGHDECNGHEHDAVNREGNAKKKPSPNAYEKMPKPKGGSKTIVEVQK